MPALTLQNSAAEQGLLRSRNRLAQCFVVFFTIFLVFRIVALQVFEHEHFQTLSEGNRIKLIPLVPTRGLIMDRNGVVLAQNIPIFSLEVIPQLASATEVMLSSLRAVIDISESDEKRFRRELKRSNHYSSVVLRSRLSEDEVARFAVDRHRFPGVDVHARLTRNYPLDLLTAHLVGYVGRINEAELDKLDTSNYQGTNFFGKTGVELFYENELHGQVGYEQVEINAQGRTLRVLDRIDSVPGKNIYLSIDIELQRVAQEALEAVDTKEQKEKERTGAIVAIDPRSGHILALVSVPSFDPNLFVHGIDTKAYQALSTSKSRPLFNRAINGRYPPGSTIKPFFALAGLNENLELANGSIRCRGFYQLKGKSHRYRDWKRSGHGKVRLKDAIAQSCDVYFYALAHELGIERMHAFMSQFGFGEPTGIDLRNESSGLMPSRAWKQAVHLLPWYPGETLITGIGQGFMLATPLQLASATATLATSGVRYRPRVVERFEDARTFAEDSSHFNEVNTIKIHTEHWLQVKNAMREVVHGKRGTARKIGQDTQYIFAGKTGTSQVFSVGQDKEYKKEKLVRELRDHALFIAYAPAKDPRITVAVIVEHGGSGGKAAALVARKVLDAYLNQTKEGRGMLVASDRVERWITASAGLDIEG